MSEIDKTKLLELVKQYKKCARTKDTWDRKRKKVRDKIFEMLDYDDTVEVDIYTVKKYRGCSVKLDEKKFAAENPEDWEKYQEIKQKMEPYKVKSEYDNISLGKA